MRVWISEERTEEGIWGKWRDGTQLMWGKEAEGRKELLKDVLI